jgi:hypothetical protein
MLALALVGGLWLASANASAQCVVPEIRGDGIAYADDLLQSEGCPKITSVSRPHGLAHRHGLVILAQAPRRGVTLRSRARIAVRLGLPIRESGCRAPAYEIRASSPEALVLETVSGDPLARFTNERLAARSYRRLTGCVPPRGRPVTLWEEKGSLPSEESVGYEDIKAAGHFVGLVEQASDQYGANRILAVFDLQRRRGILYKGVDRSTMFVGTEYRLVEYALDSDGDVAWIEESCPPLPTAPNCVGSNLYLARPAAKAGAEDTVTLIETASTMGGLSLANGQLSWSSAGAAHSVAVGAATGTAG